MADESWSDDGWGDDAAASTAPAPASNDVVQNGGGDAGEDDGGEEGAQRGGGGSGDNKCRNCKQEGHFASDCPNPEVCRRCKKEGHKKDECPEPAKCYNCREEGHETNECPEPEKCRRCKQEGHKVADCPEPMKCNRCGEEGHMVRDCTQEEQTRQYTDAEGNEKEIYVPKADCPDEELFKAGISAGLNFSKYQKIPVKVTGENIPKHIEKFEDAGLRPLLMENIKKSGYTIPTPIQKYGIPIVQSARDMMGCAQTGSGKTASFLIPIINDLIASNADSNSGSRASPQCLIVTPTRELANQIYGEARKFCVGSVLKCRVAFGGTSSSFQNNRLMQGCNILVATVGRLLDFVGKSWINFENIKYIVLDEADRMLDDGFMPEVEKIMADEKLPSKESRQTLLFSATFSDEIQEACQQFLRDDYLFTTVGMIGGVCTDVTQEFIKVEQFEKRDKLDEILQDPDRNPLDRTLVFVQTKKNADFVCANLCQNGLEATSIHGDRFLSQRFEALENFKSGAKPILVATAVAARGLDISGVEVVINYDLPREVDEYVHRIGRTGRVGNTGRAISLVDEAENADVVKKIVGLCVQSSVEIPDWLNEVAENATGGDDGGAVTNGGGAADEEEEW